MKEQMQTCVVGGAGYVGLVTSVGLAEIGHRVVSVDSDAGRVARLATGSSPIHEEGIEPMLRRNLDAGRLRFTTDLADGLSHSEVVFIAVGTPAGPDGEADLSQVIQVTEELLRHWDSPGSGEPDEGRSQPSSPYRVIVVKSTVPVGTVELTRSIFSREKREGEHFDVVSNPEFLREGKGLYDFFCPDRIILGTSSDRALKVMRALYAPIISGEPGEGRDGCDGPKAGPELVPVVETDLASAQMIKYASNAFLATRISFINEVAWLCDTVGADVKDVALGMGYDGRIGHAYLEPGIGFGGPCLEKDLSALISIGEANSYEPRLLQAVLDRNDRQVEDVVTRLKKVVGDPLHGRVISVFGLAFKAGTNDLRNSVSLKMMDRLEEEGAVLRAHDPLAIPEARASMPDRMFIEDPYETVDRADALLILTAWPEYAALDYGEIKRRMASPCIVDARNLLDPPTLESLGFLYSGIGRGTAT